MGQGVTPSVKYLGGIDERWDCSKFSLPRKMAIDVLQHLVSAPRASLAGTHLKSMQGTVIASKARASLSFLTTGQPHVHVQDSGSLAIWSALD